MSEQTPQTQTGTFQQPPSQHEHRLNILDTWFGSRSAAHKTLSNQIVVEIGCGQGDMTVALAETATVSANGKIIAIDPAPLSYGSPETLGEAQARISKSAIGPLIEWQQQDPLEYIPTLAAGKERFPEIILLAHSIFYLPSEEYFSSLLRVCRELARARQEQEGKSTRLCLCEWGMKASDPAAEAHVLAVRSQAANPLKDGNVRTVMLPERMRAIAEEVGWRVERESWIEKPSLDDGKWEIAATRQLDIEKISQEAKDLRLEMEQALGKHGGVKSMDIWCGVFDAAN